MSASGSRMDRADGMQFWWAFVLLGVLWIWFSLLILQLDIEAVRTIGIFVAVLLLVASVEEMASGVLVPGWRWLRFLMAILLLAGGVLAISWPGMTTVVLSRILGWYLLFKGTFDIAFSLFERWIDYWWLTLIVGFLEIALAFWVVGYPGRSLVLLLLWVGFSSLSRGIVSMTVGFQMRSIHKANERGHVGDVKPA